MRNSPFWWLLIGFMVLLDFYVFQAVKAVTASAGGRTRVFIQYGYWIISILAIIVLIILPYLRFEQLSRLSRSTVFALIAALFFAKLVAALFFLVDDIRRLIQWGISRFAAAGAEKSNPPGGGITRSVFLSWLGIASGGALFGTFIYGFGNKYRYQLKRSRLTFDNLPAAFKGLKIVHISDIHSGSFSDRQAVAKGVDKILAQQPDLILFTGDLVNNKAEEMDGYMDIFSRLSAPMGVYSTLGNHDYGDYIKWDSLDEKLANLDRVKKVHEDLGWRLLLDEHIVLERNGEQIALMGVQNISGRGGFHSYGNMQKAYAGSEGYAFKILMSHDPSHWDAEVRKNYTDVDLMLSGHTHGMQFGVETPGFRWSPIQYVYKQWAGLYEAEKQKLYVNRGYGFIGYPGRVGILPEITLLELT